MFSHRLLFLILSILLFCFTAHAQEAYKLPDVDRLRCDLGEIVQLDYAAQQAAEKKGKAMFIVYEKKGTALRYIDYLQKNFVNYRYPDFGKSISLQYGGFAELPKMEAWVVPQGAKEPAINNAYTEKTATIFDDYGYWYQFCPDERLPALKVFATELKQKPNSAGYIIIYYEKDVTGERAAEMSTSVRRGQRASVTDKNFLVKLGVKPSKIFTIDVGYDKLAYAHYAQLWIVPLDGMPPKLVLINNDQSSK